MEKRFKWPLKQRANHSESSPYHHNPSRGYQWHQHGHPNQNQTLHAHQHQQHPGKNYARRHHGPNSYRKPLAPPPPPPDVQVGGGAMAPPSSGGSVGAGADVVTLIVENNNLKRMIVLHLKLMQEQTDSLAAKDKDLDDQNGKLGIVRAQNQELKLAVAKLEAENEDLRKQLRRKNQRRNDDDDDDDDHLLPPAAPQQKVIRCHAETQTVLREREQSTQTIDLQPQQAEVEPRILSVEHLPAVPLHAGAVTNLPVTKRLESKGRGEFNGKKVSTFILQRMNQDFKHHIQEEKDHGEEQTKQEDEEHLPEEDDHVREEIHLRGDDDHLQMQEVQGEEVVGGDIFHDALDAIEMEVVSEELVDLEEHVQSVDANGHMEEDDDEEEQEDSEEEDDSEEDDEDEEDAQSVTSNMVIHYQPESDLWQNQINSMELDMTDEKVIAPSAHSTPNHQQNSLAEVREEVEEEQGRISDEQIQLEPEQRVEKQLDQEVEAGEPMKVDTVAIEAEKMRQEKSEIAEHALKTLLFLQNVALKQKEQDQQPASLSETPKEQKRRPDEATEDRKAIKKHQDVRQEQETHQEVPKVQNKHHEVPKEQRKHHDVPKEQHTRHEVPKAELKTPDPPKDQKGQDTQGDDRKKQLEDARRELIKKQLKVVPEQLPSAVAPKVAAVTNPSAKQAILPKALTADIKGVPAQKTIANHQSTKTQTDPLKTQRLQVKIRQYEMFSDKKVSSSDSRKRKNNEHEQEPETKVTKHMLVNDKKTITEKAKSQDQDLDHVETVKRKLAEHLKKELLSQCHQSPVAVKKIVKERTVTNLIYPPPNTSVSSTTITPAPTPSTTPTPGSTPQPTLTSSMELEITAAKSKSKAAEQIATPLTPQSNSSVSSSTSTTRKTLNNCSPHTYSKATARSGKSKSIFRTATFPYSTRTWEDQEFHCDNEFFLEEADELLADNPSLEIPKWQDIPVPPSSDKSDTEALSDADFERRHQKYVKDEIDRKCRDARYMKEQIRLEGLRMRRNQDEVLVALDPLPTSTFYPLPEDIEGIQFVSEVPVQAFGENMVNMEARDDFGVAWVDAVEAPTSIARSKALAEPVATLASKKLPTTAAEARHQEKHSSYVFPKRRKRQKNR
ncbi:protein male-specific lethal-1 isoform X1 [Drosophila gunungcola]|uniref:protein male-specific lethal-1 isoform X1 n=1 Tax=Drosophila gunungcola TaxID=103775 RepID=UPI0022E1A459|nr:protein male-specific lethal-1 isoform X1 [Drosophila gunungcola]